MTVELNEATERLVLAEIERGNFSSVEEVVSQAVASLSEKASAGSAGAGLRRKGLYELLTAAPFAGSELNCERQLDYPRALDL